MAAPFGMGLLESPSLWHMTIFITSNKQEENVEKMATFKSKYTDRRQIFTNFGVGPVPLTYHGSICMTVLF